MMPPEYINQIVTGDARVLAERIPDASVDLIFTDPPYPREYLPLYGWLAETAARVLKPGGLCMAMAGPSYLPDIYTAMASHLSYHWTFCLSMPGNSTPVFHRRFTGTGWKPVLSFSNGPYDGPYFPYDVLQSGERDKRFHSWGQHEQSAIWTLLRTKAAVVWEPFAGGGTVPAVCKLLGRQYIAFEIDPSTAERARARVDATQAMHPVFLEEQQPMELAS